jgi:prepilin-type N-terminal cleavage/methylation domain-containing protein
MRINKSFLVGFSLSELLISVAVLGLISALTLPAVYNSVQKNQKKAVLKESVSVVQTAFLHCLNMGECSSGDYGKMYDNINATTLCKESDGSCTFSYPIAGAPSESTNTNSVGYLLQTGAYMWGFQTDSVHQSDAFVIDFNGEAAPNVVGEDVLYLLRCDMEGYAGGGQVCIQPKHGSIQPIGPFSPASTVLWEDIFSNINNAS